MGRTGIVLYTASIKKVSANEESLPNCRSTTAFFPLLALPIDSLTRQINFFALKMLEFYRVGSWFFILSHLNC